jgi:Fur family transcriptional regulator, ferric uptake regulator
VKGRGELDRVHDTATARLRAATQRYTGQRRRLIEILARAGQPLAIPDILRGRRGLAQSSVYRNLAALEVAGVVRRVKTGEEFAKYELSEELTGHHHHLICATCGRTEDVTLPPDLEHRLDTVLDRVARGADFADVVHRVDVLGTCSNCAQRGISPGAASRPS